MGNEQSISKEHHLKSKVLPTNTIISKKPVQTVHIKPAKVIAPVEEPFHKKVIRDKLNDYYNFNSTTFQKQFAPEPQLYVNSNDYTGSNANSLFQRQLAERELKPTISPPPVVVEPIYTPFKANAHIKLSMDKCTGFTKQEQDLMVYYGITLEDIDPFNLLSAKEDITIYKLYDCYRKLRLKNHPDKNGNPEHFITIMSAMRKMEDLEKKKEMDKDSNTLREQFKNNEIQTTYIDSLHNSKDDFNNKFNKMFEENRFTGDIEQGYGDQMIMGNTLEREEMNVENTLGSYNKQNFNEIFQKQKASKSTQLIHYTVPEAIDSYNGNGSSLVGTEAYTRDGTYTDYMEAFSDTALIDTTGFSINDSKDLEKLVKEYKQSSLELRPEQAEAIEKYYDTIEKKKHQELEYFSSMEQKIKTYDDNMKLLTKKF